MTRQIEFSSALKGALAHTSLRERLSRSNSHNSPISSVGQFMLGDGGGGSFDGHWHPYEEVWLIRSGRGKLRLGKEVVEVSAGDVLFLPARLFHDVLSVRSSLSVFWVSLAFPGQGEVHQAEGSNCMAERHRVEVSRAAE